MFLTTPVSTKGARRLAKLAFMRFLRQRIRLTQKDQKAKRNAKRKVEPTA